MNIYLETERLILRQFTEDDADNLLALDSDPDVMRYIGAHALGDREAYRERIRSAYFTYYANQPGHGFWAVITKAGGAFLGWICLRPALDYPFAAEAGHRAEDLELGYRLHKAAWGQGYATEAARALVHKAFADLGATCVVAVALADNVASTRVMEKAGLKWVSTFALPGYERPAVKYALCREHRGTEPSLCPGR